MDKKNPSQKIPVYFSKTMQKKKNHQWDAKTCLAFKTTPYTQLQGL